MHVLTRRQPVTPSTPYKHWSVRPSPHRHPVNPKVTERDFRHNLNGYGTAMDFQIWLVPVLSLIGGAAGAAIINGAFGIKKLKADRRDEHQRWLRDKKQEAYVEFLEGSRVVLNLAFQDVSDGNLSQLNDAADAVKGSPIRLLAPREVIDRFDKAYDIMAECVAIARDGDLSPENRTEQLANLRGDVEGIRTDLAAICRADLIEGEEEVAKLSGKPPTQVVRVNLAELDFPAPKDG